MTLGQNIIRLRTARGYSQAALAEALEVSRQSVSKWETDASVPELEKLMKMAKLFEVSLDELVTGEAPTPPEAPPPQVIVVEKERKRETRKTVGVVFLVLALFCLLSGNVILQILCALPLLAIGLICLAVSWHPGLCCLWTVGFMADTYLRFGTGLNWRVVRMTPYWTPELNYFRLFTAWAQLVGMVLIILISIVVLRKETRFPRWHKGLLLALPVIGIVLRVLLVYIMAGHYIQRFWMAFIEWPVMALTVALALRWLRRKER